jgi:hypothetical protein
MSSVKSLGLQILEGLLAYCPSMQKNPREKLATLVGVAIESGSCNLMEWSARLPVETEREASRYAWIERFMQADTVKPEAVMGEMAVPVLAAAARNGQTVVLCIDQTSIRDTHGILVLSVRVAGRGIPLFWRVKEGQGNIGFEGQKELLEWVDKVLPVGAKVLLLGDRFFGTAALVRACQERKWSYRLRLRENLTLTHEGGDIRTGEVGEISQSGIENAELYDSGVLTNIGFLHEKGHPEPWILAMNALPSRTTVLDYGLRWSIESMFSDFKTRGFGLEDTHLQRADRVGRLILVLAVAMIWSVSVGIQQILKKSSAP